VVISRCPGQDRRYWKSEDVFDAPCPHCGKLLEFWKIEARRRCIHCGRSVLNPKLDLGCAKWCKFAADCLGITTGAGADTLSDNLIQETRLALGNDPVRMQRALEVLNHAETIFQEEPHADPLVVKAAAILLEVGWTPGGAGKPLDVIGAILAKFGVDAERSTQVRRIIECYHSCQDIDATEYRIVCDAGRLAGVGTWADRQSGNAAEPALYTKTAQDLAARKRPSK
jgi:hypothetical protein